MNKDQIISRIIELEIPITTRTVNDHNFKPNDGDEYVENRKELKLLREQIEDIIYPKSYLTGGINPQKPDYKRLQKWRENINL